MNIRIGLGIAAIVVAGAALAYCVKNDVFDDLSWKLGLNSLKV